MTYNRVKAIVDIDMDMGTVHIQTPMGLHAIEYNLDIGYPKKSAGKALIDWLGNFNLKPSQEGENDE